MITVMILLALIALGLTIHSAMKGSPLWPAVFVLCLIELIRAVPLGR